MPRRLRDRMLGSTHAIRQECYFDAMMLHLPDLEGSYDEKKGDCFMGEKSSNA